MTERKATEAEIKTRYESLQGYLMPLAFSFVGSVAVSG